MTPKNIKPDIYLQIIQACLLVYLLALIHEAWRRNSVSWKALLPDMPLQLLGLWKSWEGSGLTPLHVHCWGPEAGLAGCRAPTNQWSTLPLVAWFISIHAKAPRAIKTDIVFGLFGILCTEALFFSTYNYVNFWWVSTTILEKFGTFFHNMQLQKKGSFSMWCSGIMDPET